MTDIKLKRGSGVPSSGDLAQGEPALDLTNKRLYTSTDGSDIVEVGTTPSELTVTGTASFTGDLSVGTEALFVDATNNRVGINSSSAEVALYVGGDADVSGFLSVDTDTLWVDAFNDRVGINTGAPVAELDVVGDARITGSSVISGTLQVDTDTLFVNTTSDRVGINTSTPRQALDVNGNLATTGALLVDQEALITGSVYVDTDTFVVDIINSRVGINNLTPSADLEVGSNHLVVDVAGNAVGIGTFPTLGANLHVKDNGGGNCVCYFENGGTGFITVLDLDNFNRIEAGDEFRIQAKGGDLVLHEDGYVSLDFKRSSAPTGTFNGGEIYYDTTTNKLRCHNGTTWNDLF